MAITKNVCRRRDRKMKKVFCRDCEFYKLHWGVLQEACTHPDNWIENYLSPHAEKVKPSVKNEFNTCRDFKKKNTWNKKSS
jgi:hypothetical protein